jgi:hypothetical protein
LPFSTNYGTGIVAKSNDKFCAVLGEYGADSATPGVAFMHVVDPNGNAFPGAPAVGPILNQGALNFTGYITNTGRTPTSPSPPRSEPAASPRRR